MVLKLLKFRKQRLKLVCCIFVLLQIPILSSCKFAGLYFVLLKICRSLFCLVANLQVFILSGCKFVEHLLFVLLQISKKKKLIWLVANLQVFILSDCKFTGIYFVWLQIYRTSCICVLAN